MSVELLPGAQAIIHGDHNTKIKSNQNTKLESRSHAFTLTTEKNDGLSGECPDCCPEDFSGDVSGDSSDAFPKGAFECASTSASLYNVPINSPWRFKSQRGAPSLAYPGKRDDIETSSRHAMQNRALLDASQTTLRAHRKTQMLFEYIKLPMGC